jgi:arabinofuranosyltransferase
MRDTIRRHGLGVGAALLGYALVAYAVRGFVTDDALITLRYARHLAAGHGIVWNVGQDPVEGFTNFSHVLFGALALELGLPALTTVRAFNVLASGGLVVLTYAFAWRLLRARSWAAVAALLVALHPALAYWSASGLETGSYAAALLLGVWALDRERSSLAGASFFFCALTRFEGALVAVAIVSARLGVDWLRGRRSLRRHVPALVGGALAYGLYFAWRYQYFGHLLSNSAYYKSGSHAGATLLLAFAFEVAPFLVLVPFARWTALGATGAMLAAALVVYVAGSYGVKPSVAYMHRFFLPVYAPVVLLACSAAMRGFASGRRAVKLVAVGALLIALAWDGANPRSGIMAASGESYDKGARMRARARVAALIAQRFSPCAAVAVQDVGAVGYLLRNPVIDTFGLNDEAFAHRFARKRQRYLEHVLDQTPDAIVLVSKDRVSLVPHYYTDQVIAQNSRFVGGYERIATVASENESYHYMIYGRQPPPPNAPRASAGGAGALEVDERLSVAAAIEALSLRIAAAQRNADCKPAQHSP